jgi:hypothetical protein
LDEKGFEEMKNAGVARQANFIANIFKPPTPGRKVTPPDARKRRFLRNHSMTKDIRRNI